MDWTAGTILWKIIDLLRSHEIDPIPKVGSNTVGSPTVLPQPRNCSTIKEIPEEKTSYGPTLGLDTDWVLEPSDYLLGTEITNILAQPTVMTKDKLTEIQLETAEDPNPLTDYSVERCVRTQSNRKRLRFM